MKRIAPLEKYIYGQLGHPEVIYLIHLAQFGQGVIEVHVQLLHLSLGKIPVRLRAVKEGGEVKPGEPALRCGGSGLFLKGSDGSVGAHDLPHQDAHL